MTWDPIWERVFRSQAWGRYPGEDLIRFVARNYYSANDRASVRFLEVGCGTGANLWFLAREGFSACGIEGSAAAVAIAEHRLADECDGWNKSPRTGWVVVGDIKSIPAEDNSFDALVDCEAVCCNSLEDSRSTYCEMFRVAKPGARIFVRTFATGSWGDGSSQAVAPRAYIAEKGPLAGKGYSRFTDREEIPDLLSPWKVQSVELITRTADNGANVIREWIVEGSKDS